MLDDPLSTEAHAPWIGGVAAQPSAARFYCLSSGAGTRPVGSGAGGGRPTLRCVCLPHFLVIFWGFSARRAGLPLSWYVPFGSPYGPASFGLVVLTVSVPGVSVPPPGDRQSRQSFQGFHARRVVPHRRWSPSTRLAAARAPLPACLSIQLVAPPSQPPQQAAQQTAAFPSLSGVGSYVFLKQVRTPCPSAPLSASSTKKHLHLLGRGWDRPHLPRGHPRSDRRADA